MAGQNPLPKQSIIGSFQAVVAAAGAMVHCTLIWHVATAEKLRGTKHAAARAILGCRRHETTTGMRRLGRTGPQ